MTNSVFVIPIFRSGRAVQAVLHCLNKAMRSQHLMSSRPKVVVVSDTPAVVKSIMYMSNLSEFVEVIIQLLIAKLHATRRYTCVDENIYKC